jgi:hypothetical protein
MDDKIAELSKLSIDELAIKLAEETSGSHFGSTEPSPNQKKELGFAIFHDMLAEVKPLICQNPKIQQYLVNPLGSSETELVATFIDILTSVAGGIPILMFSVMIVKYGIRKVCDDCEES